MKVKECKMREIKKEEVYIIPMNNKCNNMEILHMVKNLKKKDLLICEGIEQENELMEIRELDTNSELYQQTRENENKEDEYEEELQEENEEQYYEQEETEEQNNHDIEADYQNATERVPLLFVDVNLGQGRAERIIVYEGDRSEELAQRFAEENGKLMTILMK